MIYIMAFTAGIFSFFSPCVLPILPLYIGYLGGNNINNRKKIIIHTIFFVLGVSFALFSLAFTFLSVGVFLIEYRDILLKISGVFIILMGLFQLGILKINFLERERKLNLETKTMNPLVAFLLGFTFSFSWAPCIGPALSSILVSITSFKNYLEGSILMGAYTLGFIIPFLITGIFSSIVLKFLKKNGSMVKYTSKILGIIVILTGVLVLTDSITKVSDKFSNIFSKTTSVKEENQSKTIEENSKDKKIAKEEKKEETSTKNEMAVFEFNLLDQYGNSQSLSQYKGKIVFLNFWATWCPPCKEEMPYIQELYKEYGENKGDVIFLGINKDDESETVKLLNDNGYTFPVVTNNTENLFNIYGIRAFPTTFILKADGTFYGYVVGGITKEQMKAHIEEAKK